MFVLNPHSGIPLYRQLREQIQRLIAGGQLRPGMTLPSIRDLALRHAINPMTVSKVYNQLEAEGLLERNRGRPMTVAAQPKIKAPRSDRLHQIDTQIAQLILAARQLELDPDDVINAIRKKWEIHDE
jgi:GntR family transcriptional regulator